MSSQEERYQSTLNQLHSDISELKSSTQRLNEENLTLRAQVLFFFCISNLKWFKLFDFIAR